VGRLLNEASRSEALDKTQQAIVPLLESKEQVVHDVIAQRCSLKEALTRLQEVDDEVDLVWSASFSKLSEIRARIWPSEVEGHYQYTITTVKGLLRDRPDEAAAVLRRLAKDYQQLQTSTQTPSTVPMERTERHR
jgi:lipopolysaccharide biosynthesis regulator YciM